MKDIYTITCQHLSGNNDIILPFESSDRERRRMLKQEEDIRNKPFGSGGQ